MTNYENMVLAFEEVKSGKAGAAKFYSALWAKVMYLNPEERKLISGYSEKIPDTEKINKAHQLYTNGFFCIYSADFSNAINNIKQALAIYEELNEHGGCMAANTLLCVCYRSIGQLDVAQAYVQEALKYAKNPDFGEPYSYFYTVTFYQAGELSAEFKNFDDAIEFYNTGLKYTDLNQELEGRILCGLGTVYMNTGNWEESIKSFYSALDAIVDQKNYLLISKIYSDISIYYLKREEYEKALENQHKSLKLRLENNFLNPATTSYVLLAEIYFKQGNFKEAIHYGELGAEQAAKLNTIIKLFEAHETLSKAYESIGNVEKAFDHYKKFQKYKAEVHNQETIKKIEKLNNQHKMETVQNEKEIFRLRNFELKSAFDEIENKQNEILDSIRYALRIQNALLPPESYIEKTLARLLKN